MHLTLELGTDYSFFHWRALFKLHACVKELTEGAALLLGAGGSSGCTGGLGRCWQSPAGEIWESWVSLGMQQAFAHASHVRARNRLTTPEHHKEMMTLSNKPIWQVEWGAQVFLVTSHTPLGGGHPFLLRPAAGGSPGLEVVLGLLLHLQVQVQGQVLNLLNVYAPAKDLELVDFFC